MKEQIELSFDYLSNQNKFNMGKILMDILVEDYNIPYKNIKNKLKKECIDLVEVDMDEAIGLFNLDHEVVKDKIRERIKESLGDNSKIDFWLNYFNIPLNDRMRTFQLFLSYMKIFYDGEKRMQNTIKDIKNKIEEIHYFNIESTLAEILNHTDSKETNLPYDNLFIATNVVIENKRFLGFLVMNMIDEKSQKPMGRHILSFFELPVKESEIKIAFGYSFIDMAKNKDIVNFIYSFANFLNEREVILIEKEFNEKNNKRREERGRLPLPKESLIIIEGELKRYINLIELENERNFYYSVWVRGHFFHFRNKSIWKGVYAMSKEELKKKNYQEVNGIIRFWKKPFIHGKGELKKSLYILK